MAVCIRELCGGDAAAKSGKETTGRGDGEAFHLIRDMINLCGDDNRI